MLKTLKIIALVLLTLLIPVALTSCVYPHWDVWSPFRSILGIPFGLISLALYFLPTIIAAVRRSKGLLGIVLLNIFLGWTFIGWVIALVWSIVGEAQKSLGK